MKNYYILSCMRRREKQSARIVQKKEYYLTGATFFLHV